LMHSSQDHSSSQAAIPRVYAYRSRALKTHGQDDLGCQLYVLRSCHPGSRTVLTLTLHDTPASIVWTNALAGSACTTTSSAMIVTCAAWSAAPKWKSSGRTAIQCCIDAWQNECRSVLGRQPSMRSMFPRCCCERFGRIWVQGATRA
jgi:hypothetical protein